MLRRPPRSTRTDPLFPYTTLFRSIYGTSTDSSSLQGRLPVAGHRISPFGAYPNARSRQTGVILESIDECNPLCHDLNPKNPRVIPVNINLASEKGHRQLTRKTLINITKQLTAIIIRCKENHCMKDFSGLCQIGRAHDCTHVTN